MFLIDHLLTIAVIVAGVGIILNSMQIKKLSKKIDNLKK